MGLAEILTIIFVICKLAGVVSWSWWIVFIPMYPAIVIYLLMIIGGIVGARKVSKEFKKM